MSKNYQAYFSLILGLPFKTQVLSRVFREKMGEKPGLRLDLFLNKKIIEKKRSKGL